MKLPILLALLLTLTILRAEPPPAIGKTTPLFDGKTLAGWEGDPKFWRVEDGCLTGGTAGEKVPHNDFLASVKDYGNFIVRMKIKLTGTDGFVNSGFQIRSQRVPNNPEMAGYQCDWGDPSWYGCVYDESRRNKLLAQSDMAAIEPVLKRGDWNEYIIRADGPRITTWINGVHAVDFTESDPAIPLTGKFGLQIHGGGKTVAQAKDLTIEELPERPKFVVAPEPPKPPHASPLTAEEELPTFSLPPGFEIELVAKEEPGIGKFITVDWDQRGRMWSMTALEYPVDGNENAAQAKALYENPGRDKVLVFDTPFAPGVQKPRIFADGLAIPEGILPYKDGCYVQHGPNIELLHDTDGDGKADKTEVILSGFGVQDSHLFPHQFTRAPGGWIWVAQGAFNYGTVKTTTGVETKFDQTRMAKFRPDGADFEITSQGPCNIWGLVLDGEGQAWIQEANDYGYPVMPFHEYANYPGCSERQWKSYAPEFPGTAPEFKMGGTGLSGLALSDKKGAWPEAYADVMFVANPITRKIQAIKITPDGPRFSYRLLGDFIRSSDEMFRPVSIHFGPDGCLYIVDWYNKIISHNEVPRNHPDRDKTRGRIWRVKHKDQTPFVMEDFTKATGDQLLAKLGGESLTQSHLAWQAIGDRAEDLQKDNFQDRISSVIHDKTQSASRRIQALWALEGLEHDNIWIMDFPDLAKDPNRNVRRELVRMDQGAAGTYLAVEEAQELSLLLAETDPEVRAQLIRTVGARIRKEATESVETSLFYGIGFLLSMIQPSLNAPTAPSTQNKKTIKIGAAYDREFERYVVRFILERRPDAVAKFLDFSTNQTLGERDRKEAANGVTYFLSDAAKTFDASDAARKPTTEALLLASLALEPKVSAARVAQLLPKLTRPPGQEEVLRLAEFLDEPGVGEALKATLENPATRNAALESLLATRTRLDATKLMPLLADAAAKLLASPEPASVELGVKIASDFKIASAESALLRLAQGGGKLAALRALREIGSAQTDFFVRLLHESKDPLVRDEALNALASAKSDRAGKQVLALWPELSPAQRRDSIDRLTTTKPGAQTVLAALTAGTIAKTDLDGSTLDKLQAVVGDDPALAKLTNELGALFRPVLTLDGGRNAWTETGVTLDGPFTVETWVLLDPKGRPIGNDDAILGVPGKLSMNFYNALFRVWDGSGDMLVAKKPMVPGIWTHIAVTRDEKGAFKIYQDGSLDQEQSKLAPQKFENVRIGGNGPGKGTAGALSEFRIWNRVRSADEIRNDFDRSYDGQAKPPGLVFYAPGAGPWGKVQGGAKIAKTSDFPPILTSDEATQLDAKFAKYRALAGQPGDAARGKAVTQLCQACHLIQGQGGNLAPNLSGAGAMGVEGLLRNIITPNAAMENGYHLFRVELKSGDLAEGFFVSDDKDAVVLRAPGAADRRIEKRDIRASKFLRRSIMPEGLLDTMQPQQVSDLFAYLMTLK